VRRFAIAADDPNRAGILDIQRASGVAWRELVSMLPAPVKAAKRLFLQGGLHSAMYDRQAGVSQV